MKVNVVVWWNAIYFIIQTYEYHLDCDEVDNTVALVSKYSCKYLLKMDVDYFC